MIMLTIFNLVLFLVSIYILVSICNNMSKKENINDIDFEEYIEDYKNIKSTIPSSHDSLNLDFNYEDVPKNDKPFDLETKFYKELNNGAHFMPEYFPPKDYEDLEFYKKEINDQTVIYDNRLYEKPIHRYRQLENNDEDAPKKISEIFDQSIIDFKSLVPLKKGKMGDVASSGGFDLHSYTPDFVSYEDEKPENGGMLPNLYNGVFGFDPLIEKDSAIF